MTTFEEAVEDFKSKGGTVGDLQRMVDEIQRKIDTPYSSRQLFGDTFSISRGELSATCSLCYCRVSSKPSRSLYSWNLPEFVGHTEYHNDIQRQLSYIERDLGLPRGIL